MLKQIAFIILTMTMATQALAKAKKTDKGLLPEIRTDSKDDKINQKREVQSEVLITKTENEAINALISILKKKKGSPQEPELWLRLGELYQRRAKSGRFFDLFRDQNQIVKFAPPAVAGESAKKNLLRAISVYDKVEKDFPKFNQLDIVFYNNAFSRQQIGDKKNAGVLYQKLTAQYPKSPLVPDALLALGEIHFENQDFNKALQAFLQIEEYKKSRVYAYGMYKSAWAYYNLRQNDAAISKLKQVIIFFRTEGSKDIARQNVRQEALRDLAIFFGESHTAAQAYEFFSGFAEFDEIGYCMLNLAKLYMSHSRQKEVKVFLEQFLQKQPNSKEALEMHLLLVNTYEDLKEREQVLVHLKASLALCRPENKWYVANGEAAKSMCENELISRRSDIAKRWWELWLKKKDNKELARWTEQIFEMILERDSKEDADLKSRFAYAELLFQQNKFKFASKQYEFVGDNIKDATIIHDADYASLVSYQKAIEEVKDAKDSKKNPADLAKLEDLSKRYLKKHPTGPYAAEVQLKLAVLKYENNDLNEAEKHLKDLMTKKANKETKRKAEDLYLDILNARKDFKSIQEFTKNVTTKEDDGGRKVELSKLFDEASFAEIQELNKSGKKDLAADKLYEFYQKNQKSNLAKEALWQSLSINYSLNRDLLGANQSVEFYDKYRDDKKALSSLKDAAKVYYDLGFTDRAAVTLERIANVSDADRKTSLVAAAELYTIDKNYAKAHGLYKTLMPMMTKAELPALYEGLLDSTKNDPKERQKYEQQIVSNRIEPLASKIRIQELRDQVAAKKFSQAFNTSKSMVGDSSLPNDVRAEARLIQAQILDIEFTNQPTKTSIERLSAVLGIKTEKLDKAQTAYISVGQIAESADLKIKALQGLDHIYNEYIKSIKNLNLKTQLSADDKKALDEELAKLVAPIDEKKKENNEKLRTALKVRAAASKSFADLSPDDTVRPGLDYISMPVLSAVWLYNDKQTIKPFTSTTGCPNDAKNMEYRISALPTCIQKKRWEIVEKHLVQLAFTNKSLSLYYRALAAQENQLWDKARWLIDLYSKDEALKPFGRSEMARTLYLEKSGKFTEPEKNEYMNLLAEAHKNGIKNSATVVGKTFSLFQNMQCLDVIDIINKEASSEIRTELLPLKAECMANSGEFDAAVGELESLAKSKSSAMNFLFLAHVQEKYRFDSMKAVEAYQAALKNSKDNDLNDWIKSKVQTLGGAPANRISTTQEEK
jgi:TolA-binding protein